jgi:putative sigma-54 modulation protein
MTIEAQMSFKNLEATEKLKEYVNKKMVKIDRLLPNIQEADVDLSFVKTARNIEDRNVAQITIHAKSCILRTEERSNDIMTSIDSAMEKMHHQIERYKSRKQRSRKAGVAEAIAVEEAAINIEAEPHPLIARRKSFTVVPMDELEAIEQMRLLEHENFFIFYNANTNSINVLYRRRDGDYGLIEPKLG